MNFRIKQKLILWISEGKRKSFLTQEVGRKMTFLYYLQNLHDILRNEKDRISVLKKNDHMKISLARNIMFTDY